MENLRKNKIIYTKVNKINKKNLNNEMRKADTELRKLPTSFLEKHDMSKRD